MASRNLATLNSFVRFVGECLCNICCRQPNRESHMTLLIPAGDQLPPEYRFVTVREVHDHREALERAIPGWEIANLADGSVDRLCYGDRARLEGPNDVRYNLVTYNPTPGSMQQDSTQDPITTNATPSMTFSLLPVGSHLFEDYRLATVQEVQGHPEALMRAMPGWEIANLADGSALGFHYGLHTSWKRRDDVVHNLVTQNVSPGSMQQDPILRGSTQDPNATDVRPGMTFSLFPIGTQLPPEYRLVTVREVHDHPEALKRVMPGWEIANLADGSVDGHCYGGRTRLERYNDVGHNLVTRNPTPGSVQQDPMLPDSMQDLNAADVRPGMTFSLVPIGGQLPADYRLATEQEVLEHPEALMRAMPGWEIANLADGSVDGFHYGDHTRLERRNDVGHNLVTRNPTPGSMQQDPMLQGSTQDPNATDARPCMTFSLVPVGSLLPPHYRLATVQEVLEHPEALMRAMPGWEIANLADGSVDGFHYGEHTRLERYNDVGHNLVTRNPTPGSVQQDPMLPDSMQDLNAADVRPGMTFSLVPIGGQLPADYRLATEQEVLEHPEALMRAMPGWEIANLADGSVDGFHYGDHTRLERYNDVGHNLVTHNPTPGSMQQDPMLPGSMQDLNAADVRPGMTFSLVPIGGQLPADYRLATVQEVLEHPEALMRAMPGWEIANLADGSVDGRCYGGRTRSERRDDVGHNLATRFVFVEESWTSSTSGASTSTSEYFSPSVARMKELMDRPGIDKVEAEIEASKDHWTELMLSTTESSLHVEIEQLSEKDVILNTSEGPSGVLGIPDEQLFESLLKGEWTLEKNEKLFQCLEKGDWNSYTSKKTPPEVQANLNFHLLKEDWSRFFKRMDGSTALDAKPFAIGGQAELFLENQVAGEGNLDMRQTRHVLKVFKCRKALRDLLQDEIPRGMLKQLIWTGGMPSGRKCRHRCNIVNIVLLENGKLAFRMPLYGGDLRKFISERKMQDNNGAPFSDDVATLCMLQIAMAMEDLHDDGIIHNDLKASNVLISNTLTGSEPVTREYPLFCWVADFECSIGTMGTGFWRAPEILRAIQEDKLTLDCFTKESDVYSYGMTCYEILTGLKPFEYEGHAQDSYEVVRCGVTPKLPSDIKPWIKALLNRCWHQIPSRRPTFEEIVSVIMKEEPSSGKSLYNLLRGSY